MPYVSSNRQVAQIEKVENGFLVHFEGPDDVAGSHDDETVDVSIFCDTPAAVGEACSQAIACFGDVQRRRRAFAKRKHEEEAERLRLERDAGR